MVVGAVRRKATECESSTKNVVQQAVCQVPVVVAPALVSTSALSQVVRMKRRAAMKSNDEVD